MEEQLNLFLNQQSKTEPDEEPTKKPNPDPQKIIHPFSQRAITYVDISRAERRGILLIPELVSRKEAFYSYDCPPQLIQ